jgi:hypothetical protein
MTIATLGGIMILVGIAVLAAALALPFVYATRGEHRPGRLSRTASARSARA